MSGSPFRLRAGEVLDSGGQGCIFAPPLYPVKRKFQTVSKVLAESEARKEYEVSMDLKKLDPKGRYGLYPTAPWNCGVTRAQILANAPSLMADTEHDTCEDILRRADSKTYCSIEYERFDKTLKRVIKGSKCPRGLSATCPEAIKVLQSMADVWHAVAFLRRHSFVHGDIKASNVAKRRNGHLFLTDWGWSGNLNSGQEVRDLLAMMVQYDDYAVHAFGGREDGIWSPVLWTRGVDAIERRDWNAMRDVLFFNDLFMVAYMTQYAIRKMRANVPKLEALLNRCVAQPEALYDAGPSEWSAYERQVLAALKRPESGPVALVGLVD